MSPPGFATRGSRVPTKVGTSNRNTLWTVRWWIAALEPLRALAVIGAQNALSDLRDGRCRTRPGGHVVRVDHLTNGHAEARLGGLTAER